VDLLSKKPTTSYGHSNLTVQKEDIHPKVKDTLSTPVVIGVTEKS